MLSGTLGNMKPIEGQMHENAFNLEPIRVLNTNLTFFSLI